MKKFMNQFNNVKLKNKLILIFVGVVAMQGIFIGLFSFNYATEIITKNKMEEMKTTLDKIDYHITSQVNFVNQIARSTTSNQVVSDNIDYKADWLEKGRNKRSIDSYFSNLTASFNAISNIMIIDRGNTLYSCYEYYTIKQFNLIDSPYYEKALESNRDLIWMGMTENLMKRYEPHKNSRVLSVVSPIYDYFREYIIGVLIINMDPSSFKELLSPNQESEEKQFSYMVDQKNELICSSGKLGEISLLTQILAQLDGSVTSFELNIQQGMFIVSYKENEVTGWKTITAVPYNDVVAQSIKLRSAVSLTVFFSTLFLACIISVLSYSITKPIKDLTTATQLIQDGNLEFHGQTDRKDEIGLLSASFKRMIDQINSLINEVYKQKLNQKNAELKALQSQINPHFLYNTLDTINWMLIDRQEYEISELIIAIGDLMKYCINKGDSTVTVRQEIEHITNYLMIQKARMEEKIAFEIDIPPEVQEYQIPKLTLHPLVENAMVHGLECSPKPGLLKIYAEEIGGSAYLTVEDNGIGIDADRLDSIIKNPLVGTKEAPGHTHIGISNVDQRIKLKYGEKYGLEIISIKGVGTKVVLNIPKNLGGHKNENSDRG